MKLSEAQRNKLAAHRNWATKLHLENGCHIWTGARCSKGYATGFWDGKTRKLHRVSYELHNGPIPDGMNVCHRCDRPSCINPDHLFLGTTSDNMRDMVAKGRGKSQISSRQDHFPDGRAPWGERASGHKLTNAQAAEIIAARRSGTMTKVLAERYGLERTTIQKLVRGASWKRLPGRSALAQGEIDEA